MTQDPNPDTPGAAEAEHEGPRPGARLRQALSVAGDRIDPANPWSTTRPNTSIDKTTVDDPFPEPAQMRPQPVAVPDPPAVTPPLAGAPATDAVEVTPPAPHSQQVATETQLQDKPAVATPVEDEPPHVVVDLRANRGSLRGPLPARRGQDYGLGQRWGAQWRTATQGWIDKDTGRPVWRPVISTTEQLELWAVDTYLGVVDSEVAVEALGGDFHQLGSTLAQARELGMKGLLEEAIERGAHAVLGVNVQYTPLGDRLLMTITGTAVTLRERD